MQHARDYAGNGDVIHYFYRSVKNYGGRELADAFISGIRRIFNQDKPVLEAQQRRIGSNDLQSLQPVLFGGDMLPQKARRINRKLLDQEAAQSNPPSVASV